MAYRKRSQSRRKRPAFRRRKTFSRQRRPRKAKMYRQIQFAYAPPRKFLKFRYADAMSYTVNSGVLTFVYAFQSSLFSPRDSGGHQPLCYDQWCPGFYGRYRVYGIKYNFTFINSKIDETWYAFVEHENDMPSTSSLQTMMERIIAKARVGGSYRSSNNKINIKGYMDVAKTLGVSKNTVMNEQDYQAAYNTNPTRMAFLRPYLSHNNASTQTFDVIARLTYYAVLEDRVWQSAS